MKRFETVRGHFGVSLDEKSKRTLSNKSSFKEQVVGNFLVKYDPSSGCVLVGHIKDRQIRTFYKDDGRSADPFQAAIDLAKSLGGG